MSYIDAFKLYNQGQESENLKRPLRGIVTGVLPEKELYKIESFGTPGSPQYAIRHPFLGVNSWIRAVGEPGTTCLIQQRGDLMQQEIWGYISNKTQGVVQQSIREKAVAYRVLRPGENEVMSSGKAGVYWNRFGNLEMQGGSLRLNLKPTEAEIYSAAPTYKKTWWLHQPNTLGHEERTGVVKRPNKKRPYSQQDIVKLSNQKYAVEHSRWVHDSDNQPLTELQEGHVINQSGSAVSQGSTNKDLRYLKKFHSTVGGTLNIEIDEQLNTLIKNGSTAKETKINFGAKNEVSWQAKKWECQISETGKLTFTRSLSITSRKVQVNSSDVTVGPTGAEQAVLGVQLTNTVLTPMVSTLLSGFTTLAATDPSSMIVALKVISGTFASMLGVVQANIPNTLSKQVKLSG
jgi:hypothetical protein